MRTSVLWTGGKDSALALHKARIAGHEIVNLLTFAPKKANFLAHPVSFMKYQAEAIGLAHIELMIDEPIKDAYENAMRSFKDKHKIEAFITGDIAEVDSMPNWIRQRCESIDIKVLTPLWGGERRRLFEELIFGDFKIIISCIKKGSLDAGWLGRELNEESLKDLSAIHAKTGIDICGENGEYHTLVLDGPFFNKSIAIGNYTKHATDSMMYIKPQDITFSAKE